MGPMEKLSYHLRARPAELARMKDEGTKIVGCYPGDYVPEEIIYASGAIPLCLIHGGDDRIVDASLSRVTRYLCPFSKAQVGEIVLKEQPYYNLVDMLVGPVTCQHLRRAADVWEYFEGMDVFRFGIPHEYEAGRSLEYYIETMGLLNFFNGELLCSPLLMLLFLR